MKRGGAALGIIGALTSCAHLPEPIPFAGPRPVKILVAPIQITGPRAEVEELAAAMAQMLRARGYDATADAREVGRLAEYGWRGVQDGELPIALLREDHGYDAIWLTRVAEWRFLEAAGAPLAFELEVELIATRDGARLWSQRVDGRQATVEVRTVRDAFAERDPFEADDPFGLQRVARVLDDAKLASAVAEFAGRRLPRR